MTEFIVAFIGVILFLLILPIIMILFRKYFTFVFDCYHNYFDWLYDKLGGD